MEKRIEGPRSNFYSAHTKVQALTAARDSERRELAAADAFPAGNRR